MKKSVVNADKATPDPDVDNPVMCPGLTFFSSVVSVLSCLLWLSQFVLFSVTHPFPHTPYLQLHVFCEELRTLYGRQSL